MLGQAFQFAAYDCHYHALSCEEKEYKKFKEHLCGKSDLLSTENWMLFFGGKCQTYVTYTVEARQKSEGLFQNFNKEKNCGVARTGFPVHCL